MILNKKQIAAAGYSGNICVRACPGSGKTRAIIGKILNCVDEVRGTPRRIACITYTHAAVNEIESRIRQEGVSNDDEYYEVCTIHSFCLQYFLQPNCHLLSGFADGFQVLAPDSQRWREIASEMMSKHSLPSRMYESLSSVHRDADHSVFVPSGVPEYVAQELIEKLDSESLVTFADIVYYAARLAQEHPYISRGVASRFAWVLVDEFQDTSYGQVSVLRSIASHGNTRFFLVGDPNQSIMAFAGAHRELMTAFAGEIGATTSIQFSGNYRCSGEIVCCAERLLPTCPPMTAEGPTKDEKLAASHTVVERPLQAIVDCFIPEIVRHEMNLGECAVLAPWWVPLFHLGRELRALDIPVVGPGARPYRRSRLFAQLAEHLCAYAVDASPELFRSAQWILYLMLLNITGNAQWTVFSYEGRRILLRLMAIAREGREHFAEDGVGWLRSVSTRVGECLILSELMTRHEAGLVTESAVDMIRDIERNTGGIIHTDELGLFAKPSNCLHLITMHSSKGREFDGVAIIDLHDGRLPHFSANTKDEYEEARRLFYVGITRARRLLMCFTDTSDYRNRPSPFLAEVF